MWRSPRSTARIRGTRAADPTAIDEEQCIAHRAGPFRTIALIWSIVSIASRRSIRRLRRFRHHAQRSNSRRHLEPYREFLIQDEPAVLTGATAASPPGKRARTIVQNPRSARSGRSVPSRPRYSRLQRPRDRADDMRKRGTMVDVLTEMLARLRADNDLDMAAISADGLHGRIRFRRRVRRRRHLRHRRRRFPDDDCARRRAQRGEPQMLTIEYPTAPSSSVRWSTARCS